MACFFLRVHSLLDFTVAPKVQVQILLTSFSNQLSLREFGFGSDLLLTRYEVTVTHSTTPHAKMIRKWVKFTSGLA